MKAKLKWTGVVGIGLLLPGLGLALERPSHLDTDLPLRAESPRAAAEGEAEVEVEPGPGLPELPPVPPVPPQPAPRQQGGVPGPVVGEIAYLGLGVDPLPEALGVHLGIGANEAVIVRSVDPDGPAAQAGVAEHDVIRTLDGEVVGSHADLRAKTAAHAPGDKVDILLVHKGRERVVTAQLAGRPLAQRGNFDPLPGGPAPGFDGLDGFFGGLPRDQAERIRRAIEENLRFAQDPDFGALGEANLGGLRELQRRMMDGMIDGIPDGALKMSGTSSVRLLDGEGSVEIEMRDGRKDVRVRDTAGKVVWEGPYSTEEEKAAVPEAIRQRIDRVDVNGVAPGFRLRFVPGLEELEEE